MSQQVGNSTAFQTKKYVRGAYLYSTDDGTGFQQKNRNRIQDQILIEDKGNVGSLKRQIQQKKQQLTKRKQKTKKQKQMLIPIRDTPVEPLPQPMMDNNKCQRATQEQFEYFQTYISQKQKQRKFQQQELKRLEIFERQQQRFRKNEQNQDRRGVSIVMEKEQQKGVRKILSNKKGIKIVIKKKQKKEELEKNDVLLNINIKKIEKQDQGQACKDINRKVENNEKLVSDLKNNENDEQKQEGILEKNEINKEQNKFQQNYETFTKVRLIQQKE